MGYPIFHSQYTAAQIEAAIGKGPRINTAGYWEVWNVSTGAYESTGVGAGVTPPTVVTQVSQMTNHGYIYIYNGTETGYQAGYWYYWSGSAWTAGGAYQVAATDPTLTVAGAAADAKATGDAVDELKSAVNDHTNRWSLVDRHAFTWEEGVIVATTGENSPSTYSIRTPSYLQYPVGTEIIFRGAVETDNHVPYIAYIYEYDANNVFKKRSTLYTNGKYYIVKTEYPKIRYAYLHASSTGTTVSVAEGSLFEVRNLTTAQEMIMSLAQNSWIFGNIVDQNTLAVDYYISKVDHAITPAFYPGQGWVVSDYIPVDGFDISSVNGVTAASSVAYGYNVYNANRSYIRSGSFGDDYYHYTAGDAFVRLCFRLTGGNIAVANYGSVALSTGDLLDDIAGIKDDIANIEIAVDEKTLFVARNQYVEKLIDKVLMIGDSTTRGLVSDYPYLRKNNGRWSSAAYLHKMNGWEIQNDGQNSWVAKDWITNAYTPGSYGDFQLATVEFGYNDGTIPNTIGTDVAPFDDYNDYADTPCGNYCKLIAILQAENPYMIIMPIIQAHINYTTKNTIIAICEYFGINYIDLTVTDLNDSRYHGYYSAQDQSSGTLDVVHFNILGYSRKADCIRYFALANIANNLTISVQTISQQQSAQYES